MIAINPSVDIVTVAKTIKSMKMCSFYNFAVYPLLSTNIDTVTAWPGKDVLEYSSPDLVDIAGKELFNKIGAFNNPKYSDSEFTLLINHRAEGKLKSIVVGLLIDDKWMPESKFLQVTGKGVTNLNQWITQTKSLDEMVVTKPEFKGYSACLAIPEDPYLRQRKDQTWLLFTND